MDAKNRDELNYFFKICFDQNIDLYTLGNHYIFYILGASISKKEAAKRLGFTFQGLKKRAVKIGEWNSGKL